MLNKCLSFAKSIYGTAVLPRVAVIQGQLGIQLPTEETHHEDNVLDWGDNPSPTIPRYLQLARSIHARFSAEEEREMAIYRAAEELAARKNEVIMRVVREVLTFCEALRTVPDFAAMLNKKTEDITERLFSTRCSYTVEHEPVAVQYEAPFYRVDMHTPDHVSLTCPSNAYLNISFNPVKFLVTDRDSAETSTITKHLLVKQYRIAADGTFLPFHSQDNTPVDPIAEILTELRAKLGHDFFENQLIPYFESQPLQQAHNSSERL